MSYLAYTEETHKANGVVRSIVEGIGAGMNSDELLKVTDGLLSYAQWLHCREGGSKPVGVLLPQAARPAKKKSSFMSDLFRMATDGVMNSQVKDDAHPGQTRPLSEVLLNELKKATSPEETKAETKVEGPTRYFRGLVLGSKVKLALSDDKLPSPYVVSLMKASGLEEVSQEEYLESFDEQEQEPLLTELCDLIGKLGGTADPIEADGKPSCGHDGAAFGDLFMQTILGSFCEGCATNPDQDSPEEEVVHTAEDDEIDAFFDDDEVKIEDASVEDDEVKIEDAE